MKLTTEELSAKRDSKRKDAKRRGIDFNLTIEDFRALFKRNNGHCDYTGILFNEDNHKITIERIDDKKGYIRGNICLVSSRANSVKDFSLDKTEVKVVHLDDIGEAIVKVIQEKVTEPYKKFLSWKYDPTQKFESNTYKNHFKDIDYSKFHDKIGHVVKQKVELVRDNNGELKMSSEQVSNDVRIASYYAQLAKHASGEKKQFTVSFADFKAKFSSTKCKITGQLVKDEDKVFILLDQTGSYNRENMVLVGKDVGSKMIEASKLLEMSIPEIAKNLNPFIKSFVPKKKPAPKTPLVSLGSIMKKAR